MPRKTQEEYVKQLAEKNPLIQVVGNYVNSQTKIMHHCIKHDVYWEAIPSNILKGQGCSKCKAQKISNKNTGTYEEYLEKLVKKGIQVQITGEYINMCTKVMHRCPIHNIEWMKAPNKVLEGHGCPQCAIERTYKKRAKTQEQYEQQVVEIAPHIIILGKYINANTPILHKCLIHNIEWLTSPGKILSGCSCPECGREKISAKQLRTHEEYVEELATINPNITVMEQYVNANTKIMHHCNIHNVDWNVKPMDVLMGHGCSKCHSEKTSRALMKSTEQYIKEVRQISPFIEVLQEYAGCSTPILHRCTKHNTEWRTTPVTILQGCGCPSCYQSHGEQNVAEWLDSHNFVYERQKTFKDCKDKHSLPFDFYIPDINTMVEFDGQQHYKPVDYFGGAKMLEYTQRHDEIKNEYCTSHNIPLLRIRFDQDIDTELTNFLLI